MSPGREARILDAAGELLLLHGYRRVTIDDVARRADVGKGTIYLHYSSKLELFAAVLLRVIAEITTDHLTALRDDPGEVRLHRTMRGLFLSVMRRPLARAFYTGDTELLGALVTDTKIGVQFAAERTAMDPSYLSTLYAHGLLTDDPRTTPDLQYRYKATTSGFFLLDRLLPGNGDIGLEGRADALALTVRRSFEPTSDPHAEAVATAATAVIELYEDLLAEFSRAPRSQGNQP